MAPGLRSRYAPQLRLHRRVIDGVAMGGTHPSPRGARVELHWAEFGAPSGRPVVLLHGISDSHRAWLKMAPHLAAGRRVLMPDLAGHGYSSRPDASYSLDWHARVIGRWLELEDLRDVDLVGHSYGGGVAQWMLLAHRSRIRRLGLVASGGLGREVGLPLRLSTLPGIVERLGQPFMRSGTILALRMLAAHGGLADVLQRGRMNAIAGSARALARTMRDVVSLGGQVRHFLDRAHEIAELPPIGLFWGEADPVIPVAHARALAKRLSGVPLVTFPGVGHFPQVERPVEMAHALGEFLDGSSLVPPRIATAG